MSGQGYQTALFGKLVVAVHQFDGKKYHLSECYDTEVRMKDLVLGDGLVECHWDTKEYHISDFAKGDADKKLNIPADLIPKL